MDNHRQPCARERHEKARNSKLKRDLTNPVELRFHWAIPWQTVLKSTDAPTSATPTSISAETFFYCHLHLSLAAVLNSSRKAARDSSSPTFPPAISRSESVTKNADQPSHHIPLPRALREGPMLIWIMSLYLLRSIEMEYWLAERSSRSIFCFDIYFDLKCVF